MLFALERKNGNSKDKKLFNVIVVCVQQLNVQREGQIRGRGVIRRFSEGRRLEADTDGSKVPRRISYGGKNEPKAEEVRI